MLAPRCATEGPRPRTSPTAAGADHPRDLRRGCGSEGATKVFAGRVEPTITVDPNVGPRVQLDARAADEASTRSTRSCLDVSPVRRRAGSPRSAGPGRVPGGGGLDASLIEADAVGLPASSRDVAARRVLGSKRHMMRRIFSDENEPFWRSAKHDRAGRRSRPKPFTEYALTRFEETGERARVRRPRSGSWRARAASRCAPAGARSISLARRETLDRALEAPPRSEHSRFSRLGTA